MAKREKRLKKQICGLEKQIEKHKNKIRSERGNKDTTHDYWKGEIERFKIQKKKREEILKKIEEKFKKEDFGKG